MVLLRANENEELQVVAACGRGFQARAGIWDSDGVVQRVLYTGTAELSNSLPASQYFTEMEGAAISMLCAPLKTEKRSVGVIIAVSDQPDQFTAGDLKLLNAIAMQTAPAIEIARLHQVSLENARLEQELKMAYKVQSDLLPRKKPVLPGWQLATYWQPAHMVSGDFYDFIPLPDGRLGLVIGDVTDKGMPAALVMANTRSILRAVIASTPRRGRDTPGKLLARANNLLCEDMPQKMFVTCQLAILEPDTGRLCYSNAGHPLPFQWTGGGLDELCATGMPLGLIPRLTYEDKETYLMPGDRLLMYSDGLSEAHDPQGEMFGTERLARLLSPPAAVPTSGEELIRYITGQLAEFTGPGWEQEDDVTLLVLERLPEQQA
jgi:serine phosphatase RsbU (regulator of sigma subunit)